MEARQRAALALAACLAAASGFAQAKSAVQPTPDTGVASWYGADFQGRRTSNGEAYDKEKLSCAHRTLPFGSFVLVRNLDNGSSVVVRVNDRGPFAKDRIIDLSEEAARIIGMIPTGTARVSLAVIPEDEALAWRGGALAGQKAAIGAPSGEGSAPDLPSGARVRIQVASYSSEANAKATLARLAASGLEARIEGSSGRFRVAFPELSPAEARLVSTRLESLGYRGFTIATIRPAN
jgi:rare lipoprotein A (peptidoglycan hydrolase)